MLTRARRWGRQLLLWGLRLFPEGVGGPIAEPIRSILVVRTDDRVGNLLLTTPLLAALRAARPQARLGLLCAARLTAVVAGTGLYDDLWPFEKRDFFRAPLRFWRALWRLRRTGYDVAIDAGHFHAFSFTSAALVRISGARARVGHRRGAAARLLTHPVERGDATYDAAVKLELLKPLGQAPSLARLRTELGQRRLAELQALVGGALVVNPGARKPDHRWAAEGFAEVIRQVAAGLGLPAFVAWGPGEEPLARGIAEASGAQLLPATDLEGLAAAFRAAAVVLSNDTGPMHLAVAVGTPTVTVFLSEDAPRWASPQPEASHVAAAGRSRAEVVAEVVAAVTRLAARARRA